MSDPSEPTSLSSDPAILSTQQPDSFSEASSFSVLSKPAVSDRGYFFVDVELPSSGTTDSLPLLVSDLVYFVPIKGDARFGNNWEHRLLSRAFDCVRNHLATHDLDPDSAFLESMQALYYQPSVILACIGTNSLSFSLILM
jgi:hypothetical protein